jgi:hypothetical protein
MLPGLQAEIKRCPSLGGVQVLSILPNVVLSKVERGGTLLSELKKRWPRTPELSYLVVHRLLFPGPGQAGKL